MPAAKSKPRTAAADIMSVLHDHEVEDAEQFATIRASMSDIIVNSDKNSSVIVASVVGRIDKIDETLAKMADSMVSLVRVEERLVAMRRDADGEEAISLKNTQRIAELESKIGPLIEMRKWVISAVFGIVSLVAVGAFNAVTNYQAKVELQTHTNQNAERALGIKPPSMQ
jgi:hypothetical protein